MLIHRKNWCRICGICLTCPRTKKSIFQLGDCHCIERQANHVSPKRVKGEKLFSFRYRHLSAEDIDILCELRPRFKFPTPPIERNLVRANICSTCQQRLRRARILRCLHSASKSKSEANGVVLAGPSGFNDSNGNNSDTGFLRMSHLVEAAALSQTQSQSHISAVRSTMYHPNSRPCTPTQHQIPDGHNLLQHPMSIACSAADAMHYKLLAAQNEKPTYVASLEHKEENGRYAAAAAPAQLELQQSQARLQVQEATGAETEAKAATYTETPSNRQCLVDNQKDMCDQSDDGFDDLDITHVDHEAYQNATTRPYPVSLFDHPGDQERTNHSGSITYGCSSRDRPPSNIEFRDASNSILFVEHLSSDYPLEDVFYQYFPDAPQALLFYVFGDVALPKQSTLSDIFSEFTIQELPVVVWVKMPVPYAPGLSPKWK